MEENEIKAKKSISIIFTPKQISNFKKKLKIEFYSDLNSLKEESNNINKEETKSGLYFLRYTQYTMHEFNPKIVDMIIVYYNQNKSFPKLAKSEPNFIYKLINILKNLLMNELEVAYFTVLLDKIEYNSINIEQWIFLTFVGITAKKLCGTSKDLMLIIYYFSSKDEKFIEKYSSFLDDEKHVSSIISNKISLKQINKRFKYLTKPINKYCQKNYINTNGIVDKIVKKCQPYNINENRSTNDRINKKNTTKKYNKKNKSELNKFIVTKPCELFQFENYIDMINNNTQINLESINEIENNINNNLDIFENKNIYDSDFNLSKLDSISSLNLKLEEM